MANTDRITQIADNIKEPSKDVASTAVKRAPPAFHQMGEVLARIVIQQYADAGRPYGANPEGLQRWIDEQGERWSRLRA